MSPLPESAVSLVERWCFLQVPEDGRDQIRVEAEISDRHITLIEARPPFEGDPTEDWWRLPFARLRYTKSSGLWSLYWVDRDSQFHLYDFVPASTDIADLLDEIDRDPTAIFNG